MRIKKPFSMFAVFIMVVMALSAVGVYATWQYAGSTSTQHDVSLEMNVAEEVYIIDAVFVEGGGGSLIVDGYVKCYFESKVTLSSNNTSTAKVTITVYNNALETYAFNAIKYQTEQYDNLDIEVTTTLKHGDQIEPGAYLAFETIYKYRSSVKPTNYILNSIVNFEFVPLSELPKEDEGEIAVSGALVQFQNILNNVVHSGSFNELIGQMDKNSTNDRHDNSYIGNVVGASEADDALLADLFQGNLTMIINGVETEVRVMIKREDIDGNADTGDENGNEMTIYLTTDPLTKGIFEWNKTAVVYASVFTSNNDGATWSQLGSMYEGKAIIKAYDGNPLGSGSFDTDKWVSNNNVGIANNLSISEVIATLK